MGTVGTAESPGQMWVAALYVALIQLGGGVGSIVPENATEYILFLVSIIIGSVTWAMVVGTICGILRPMRHTSALVPCALHSAH